MKSSTLILPYEPSLTDFVKGCETMQEIMQKAHQKDYSLVSTNLKQRRYCHVLDAKKEFVVLRQDLSSFFSEGLFQDLIYPYSGKIGFYLVDKHDKK